MKKITALIIMVIALYGCNIDLESAVDQLTDSLDDDSSTCLALYKDKNDNSVEADTATSTEDTESNTDCVTEDGEAGTTTSGITTDSTEDGTGASTAEDTDWISDDYADSGILIPSTDLPDDRFFMGTFRRVAGNDRCEGFPLVTRLYSHNGKVYVEDNQQDLLAEANLFQDGTFDFGYGVLDMYGHTNGYACTCFYDEDNWYGDQWMCSCEGSTICSLQYEKMDD